MLFKRVIKILLLEVSSRMVWRRRDCFLNYVQPEFTCALWNLTAPHLPNTRSLGLCSSTWSWVPGRGCQAAAAALSFSAVYFTAGILFISVCLYRNFLFPLQPPAVISEDCSLSSHRSKKSFKLTNTCNFIPQICYTLNWR